jgi:hypothetical protein
MKERERTLFWVELVCASCSQTRTGTWAEKTIKVAEEKKAAREEGWLFKGIHSFCSADCVRQFDENQARLAELRQD